jgi:arginase family enzyme
VAPANSLAPPGGLAVDDVALATQHVAERFTIAAAGIASYDPSLYEDGRVLRAGIALARELTDGASRLR